MTLGYEKVKLGSFSEFVVTLKRLKPLAKSLSLFRFLLLHLNCGLHKTKKVLSPCLVRSHTHARRDSLFFQASTFRRRGKALSNLPLLPLLATDPLSRLIELGKREKAHVPMHVRSLRFFARSRIFQWRWFDL